MKTSQNMIMFLKRYEFKRNERLSRSALEEKQLQKFRKLITFAQKYSPYYAEIIKKRAINTKNCKPEDFPILTKNDLMINFDQIVTDPRITKRAITDFLAASKNPTDLFLNEITVTHTSGSSGEIGIFVFSKEDWARGMAQITRNQPFPNPFRRKRIAFYGKTMGHSAGISWLNIIRTGAYKRYFDFLALDINSPLPYLIEQLNAFQPDSLNSYVTSTKILAEKQQEGSLKISPSEITVGGEVLSEKDKTHFEKIFDCPVNNLYSCTEHMWMGKTSQHQSKIHLREDDLIFEINENHTLISNLFNFTLPLIRYQMADIISVLKEKTESGPYVEIDGIIGRTENSATFKNRDGAEDFISNFSISTLSLIPGIRRFQIQILSKTAFNFLVSLDTSLNPQQKADAIASIRHGLKAILESKRMDNLNLEIIVVDDIPIDSKSGKFRMILTSENTQIPDSEKQTAIPG